MSGQAELFTIGEFVVDSYGQSVRCGPVEASLSPVALRVFLTLIESEAPLRREEIIERVWGPRGNDACLNQAVYELRRGLDRSSPGASRLIVTEPWNGYRLGAPVIRVDDAPSDRRPLDLVIANAQLLSEGRTCKALKSSLRLFQGAELRTGDPEASLGLAQARFLLAAFGGCYPCETIPQAEMALSKLLRANPLDGRALATLSMILWSYRGQVLKAEQLFLEALRQSPDEPIVRHWFAKFLACQGRVEEALRHGKDACAISPASLAIRCDLGQCEIQSGLYRQAIRTLSPVQEANPGYERARLLFSLAQHANGQRADAEHALMDMAERPTQDDMILAWCGSALGRIGHKTHASQVAETLSKRREHGRHIPWIAEKLVYDSIGEEGFAKKSHSRAKAAFDGSDMWVRLNPLAISA